MTGAMTQDRTTSMLRTALCAPVRRALEDPLTLEIMANPDGVVWVERAGEALVRLPEALDAANRERVIRLVASISSESASKTSPIVSAELPITGERFEGCLPPISTAPCFSIRKPATTPFSLASYVGRNTLSPALAVALQDAIEARANILVAGGTSSGKTTFTNALLAEEALGPDRVIILEDTRELKCAAADAVALRTFRNRISLRDLVRSTLRLRPDRIIVGEVRGAEALDLLKAWNTGHPGGITTLHANSAIGALTRLEQLVGEACPRIPYDLIAEAIDIVVFMSRASGERRVEDAIRVTGHNGAGYETAPLCAPSLLIVSQGDTQ